MGTTSGATEICSRCHREIVIPPGIDADACRWGHALRCDPPELQSQIMGRDESPRESIFERLKRVPPIELPRPKRRS